MKSVKKIFEMYMAEAVKREKTYNISPDSYIATEILRQERIIKKMQHEMDCLISSLKAKPQDHSEYLGFLKKRLPKAYKKDKKLAAKRKRLHGIDPNSYLGLKVLEQSGQIRDLGNSLNKLSFIIRAYFDI